MTFSLTYYGMKPPQRPHAQSSHKIQHKPSLKCITINSLLGDSPLLWHPTTISTGLPCMLLQHNRHKQWTNPSDNTVCLTFPLAISSWAIYQHSNSGGEMPGKIPAKVGKDHPVQQVLMIDLLLFVFEGAAIPELEHTWFGSVQLCSIS